MSAVSGRAWRAEDGTGPDARGKAWWRRDEGQALANHTRPLLVWIIPSHMAARRTRLARSQRRPGGYLGARRMRRYVADTLKRMRGRREGGGVWGTVEAENLKVGEHGGRASEAGAGDLIWVMCVRMDGPSVFGESVPLPALVRRYIMPRPSSRIPPWFVHPTPHVPPPRV